MSSETTAVAVQCHLQEWAAQIRECQNRPAGMSIVNWCASHSIQQGLSVSVNGFTVHVTESTPMPLFAAVLEVVRNAQ